MLILLFKTGVGGQTSNKEEMDTSSLELNQLERELLGDDQGDRVDMADMQGQRDLEHTRG